jgi:hypothetical protein
MKNNIPNNSFLYNIIFIILFYNIIKLFESIIVILLEVLTSQQMLAARHSGPTNEEQAMLLVFTTKAQMNAGLASP